MEAREAEALSWMRRIWDDKDDRILPAEETQALVLRALDGEFAYELMDVTLQDVADAAGVSLTHAFRAVSGRQPIRKRAVETYARVLATAEMLGYVYVPRAERGN